MKRSINFTHLTLAIIVVAYVVAGVQYARLTPPWQAPDEPAHFNYVRYVAEHGALPVLQTGDFPLQYLQQFTDPKQTPSMSIEPLRYESWQPPLYYLLAAMIFRLAPAAGQLLALRLFSVALGALLIVVAYRAVATLAPGRAWLALGAAAFLAAVPMHVATTAAVNNDTLAELWVALILWQTFALLRCRRGEASACTPPRRERMVPPDASPLRQWLLLGATLGLAGLTKLSTAIALPLTLAALAYVAWRRVAPGLRVRFALTRLAALCLPPVLLLAPWLARNVSVYGLGDPLAAQRHALVVEGQKRTADWLADVGPRRAAGEFLLTTFHSFWGQFGWMGVVLDQRIYQGLAALTGLAGVGLLLPLRSLRRTRRQLAEEERVGLALLAGLAVLSAASLVGYNLTFVQHQGRYLFTALIPAGVFLAAGWREITRRVWRPLAAGLLVALALALAVRSALRAGPYDKWTLAGLLGGSGGLGIAALLPEAWAGWLYIAPYILLLALDLICLYAFIVPALS